MQNPSKAEDAGYNKDSGITVKVADVTNPPACALLSQTPLPGRGPAVPRLPLCAGTSAVTHLGPLWCKQS